MNLLFICSRNKWRSRTAESMYQDSQDHVVRSAGTSPSARIKVSGPMIAWADIIFCMEDKHKEILIQKFPAETQYPETHVLHIPDEYKYMEEELIDEIECGIREYL